MSLVNDALKRATVVHKNLAPAPQHYLPLRPVEAKQSHKRGLGLVLSATWLTILVVAVFSLGLMKSHDQPAATLPSALPSTPTAKTAPVPAPIIVQASSPAVEPKPVTLPVAPPAPAPAPLRLQAVFYTPPRSSAIIGGKTVYVGDSVRGLQVVAIGSSSARLIGGGQTNVLTLE